MNKNQNYSNDNLNYNVSYTGSSGDSTWAIPDVYDYYHNYWYPIYYPMVVYEKSKADKAFAIVKTLMEEKIIDDKKLTVGKFIKLVDKITKVI